MLDKDKGEMFHLFHATETASNLFLFCILMVDKIRGTRQYGIFFRKHPKQLRKKLHVFQQR